MPVISQFVRDDALIFASFVAEHFDNFQTILVFLFSRSNSALQEQAVEHADKLKVQENAFALVSTISHNVHLYKPQQLFKKTFDIEDLKGCAEDLVADVVYYNRKEDEEFTVDDAQYFFNSVDNIEAFTKAFKEAMIKRCIKSNYN